MRLCGGTQCGNECRRCRGSISGGSISSCSRQGGPGAARQPESFHCSLSDYEIPTRNKHARLDPTLWCHTATARERSQRRANGVFSGRHYAGSA